MPHESMLRNRFFATMIVVGIVISLGIIGVFIWGCAPQAGDEPKDSGTTATTAVSLSSEDLSAAKAAYSLVEKQDAGTCAECHASTGKLEASKSSDEIDASMYLINTAFPNTLHGSLGCISCHKGDNQAEGAEQAHGDMIAYPTADGGAEACGSCHKDIVDRAATSLHFTTEGIGHYYEHRLSESGENGENLGVEYYRTEGCPDCHVDCGQCHVRNSAQNNIGLSYTGLIDGHMFIDSTELDDIQNTCLACHAGSITECYNEFDVHGPKGAQLSCMDCHDEREIHGDGTAYTTMHDEGALITECSDCHAESSLSGQWHSDQHLENATCEACHNVPYRTCTNCHGWSAAERGDEPFNAEYKVTLGYYAGKITTLVKGPVDAHMLDDVGVLLDDDKLNTQSSLYAGFAHGIVVPELNQSFCDRCHDEGTDLLKQSELQFPDYESEHVVAPLPKVDVEEAKASE